MARARASARRRRAADPPLPRSSRDAAVRRRATPSRRHSMPPRRSTRTRDPRRPSSTPRSSARPRPAHVIVRQRSVVQRRDRRRRSRQPARRADRRSPPGTTSCAACNPVGEWTQEVDVAPGATLHARGHDARAASTVDVRDRRDDRRQGATPRGAVVKLKPGNVEVDRRRQEEVHHVPRQLHAPRHARARLLSDPRPKPRQPCRDLRRGLGRGPRDPATCSVAGWLQHRRALVSARASCSSRVCLLGPGASTSIRSTSARRSAIHRPSTTGDLHRGDRRSTLDGDRSTTPDDDRRSRSGGARSPAHATTRDSSLRRDASTPTPSCTIDRARHASCPVTLSTSAGSRSTSIARHARGDATIAARPRAPSQFPMLTVTDAAPTLELGTDRRARFVGRRADRRVRARTAIPTTGRCGTPTVADHVAWAVFTPDGQPPTRADRSRCSPEPCDPGHVTVRPAAASRRQAGDWDVRVTATDAHSVPTAEAPARSPSPPISRRASRSGRRSRRRTARPLPITEPTLFQVPLVADDLDPYPPAPGDPVLGTTTFAWSILPPGAPARQPLVGATGNSVDARSGRVHAGRHRRAPRRDLRSQPRRDRRAPTATRRAR